MKGAKFALIPQQVPVSFSDFITELTRAQTTSLEDGDPGAGNSVFETVPLGWNLDTIRSLYHWIRTLPLRAPEFISYVMGRAIYSVRRDLFSDFFILLILYSAIWQKRVILKIEKELRPLWDRVPAASHPHFLSFIRIHSRSSSAVAVPGYFSFDQGLYPLRGRLVGAHHKAVGIVGRRGVGLEISTRNPDRRSAALLPPVWQETFPCTASRFEPIPWRVLPLCGEPGNRTSR